MTVFSPHIAGHVRRTAPALTGGVIDYRLLLGGELAPLDFFDARRHLHTVTGPELAQDALARAAGLIARGVGRGDRIVLVAASTGEYLATVLAVLAIGAVPCAVAPPPTPSRPESAGVRHLRAAVDVVDPVLVLAAPQIASALSVVGFDELPEHGTAALPAGPAPVPGDIHHIQLTSGSTSAPKAVLLSHGNVAHNIAALAHAMAVSPDRDRVFSWLPLYHDMGLVQVLGAMVYRLPLGMMAPLAFLRDPLAWPRHMTRHRASVTAGPPFAYRAAAEALTRVGDGSGIDLSALRFAYVGAEPIPVPTLRMFADGFAPLGLRPDALVPCYGMAESVLATTLALRPAPPGGFGRVRTCRVESHPPVVSCGAPVDGMRVRITGADGGEVPAGVTGDIQISGPSVMLGYRNPDGSLSAPPGGWHDTGDRGFLDGGEVFVVGRSKEMLIVRGRNLPPYDVEREIENLPQVGPGCAVVFSAPDERRGREAVVAVVGTRPATGDPAFLRDAVAAAVRSAFGFSADDVVLVPRGRIPRTTSGKIQRVAVRERYLAGSL